MKTCSYINYPQLSYSHGTDTFYCNFDLYYIDSDDFRDVCRELIPVKARWYHVGVELGLRPGDLDAIQNQHHDIDRALNAMVSVWLRKDYNVTRFGPPSWSRLVEAVGNSAGGRNPAHAEQIAAKHPGECFKRIPV